jgi:hypothetical protein
MQINRAFDEVLGEHRHDCVSLSVSSPNGDFALQFAKNERLVWNVASDPPETDYSSSAYEVVDRGHRYTLLRSKATTTAETIDEMVDLVRLVGGPDAKVESFETFTTFKGFGHHLGKLVSSVKQRVMG